MQEALEGLPGVEKLDVDLEEDRFDVRYDPRRVTPARMTQAVRALGFGAEVVAKPSGIPRPGVQRVDPDSLPAPLQALFHKAQREDRPVLLDFFAPG